MTGSTQLRDFLREKRGWRVVSLPYFAIDSATTDEELKAYLANVLARVTRNSKCSICPTQEASDTASIRQLI
jgi:hypothetical protein